MLLDDFTQNLPLYSTSTMTHPSAAACKKLFDGLGEPLWLSYIRHVSAQVNQARIIAGQAAAAAGAGKPVQAAVARNTEIETNTACINSPRSLHNKFPTRFLKQSLQTPSVASYLIFLKQQARPLQLCRHLQSHCLQTNCVSADVFAPLCHLPCIVSPGVLITDNTVSVCSQYERPSLCYVITKVTHCCAP